MLNILRAKQKRDNDLIQRWGGGGYHFLAIILKINNMSSSEKKMNYTLFKTSTLSFVFTKV